MTTNIVSIFSFNLLPEDPTAKEKRKVDSVNHDQVRKVAALMVAGGATVMAASMAVLYCLLTFTRYTANPNIILTKDQLDHLLWFILSPLYVVVLIGSAAFYRNYNQKIILCRPFCCCCIPSAKTIKMLTTMSILLLTLVSLVTGFFLMPTGPNRVNLILKPTNGRPGLVLSAFAQNIPESEICIRNETLDKIKCGEVSIEIINSETTSINSITAEGSGYEDAELFVRKDLKSHCLECSDKKDNFCYRNVYEASKHQRKVLWSEWTKWSKCSSVCGPSDRSRTRTYETTSNKGILCLGPRNETERCGKPACKSYKFILQDKLHRTAVKSYGAFEERSYLFEGRPSFKQKETKQQDGMFLFSDAASGEWRVSPGQAGRISFVTKPVLRSPSNTDYPPSTGWGEVGEQNQWQHLSVLLTEGVIEPCQEVQVTLFGATRENVYKLWGKEASGSYRHYDEWVRGRPVYYKTEAHNFTLSFLPFTDLSFRGWGFSDKADATYAYIMSRGRDTHSPGDVDRWTYYAGHEWKEKGLNKWPDANMTVVCQESTKPYQQ